FTQVNTEVNRALIRRLVEGVRSRNVTSFLDLYAGAGNFTLPLLAQGLSGTSVETVAESAAAAREAAREQGLSRGRFWARDVSRAVQSLSREGRRFDLVLIDPPRAGVKRGLLEMAALASGWVALCSCNPATLARDLEKLLAAGFVLEGVEAFDM